MAWSRHCRARTSACGMRRVRASQVYRRARPACPLPSEGSRSPGNAVLDVTDSAMASTPCRACWAAVPDKMGRQQLAALASSAFVIRRPHSAYNKAGKPAPSAELPGIPPPTPPAPRCLPAAATVSPSDPKWDQAAHMARALPGPFESRLSCQPVLRRVTRFGLPAVRVTRSGQEQPGALVFGQLFGPPCGGSLAPLCAPPTTWASSFSSSVRRVSLDRVSFLSSMDPSPFGMPEEPSRAGPSIRAALYTAILSP